MPDIECEIRVNGKLCKVEIDPSTLLLDLLRDELGLTGAKRGCETGYCGCCTVLMDGKAIHSCSILAMRAKEHEILTIEGMETDGKSASDPAGFFGAQRSPVRILQPGNDHVGASAVGFESSPESRRGESRVIG